MLTIFRDTLFGLMVQDDEGNRLVVVVRSADTSPQEMCESGFTRFQEAYPNHEIRWDRMDPVSLEGLYVE